MSNLSVSEQNVVLAFPVHVAAGDVLPVYPAQNAGHGEGWSRVHPHDLSVRLLTEHQRHELLIWRGKVTEIFIYLVQ